MNLKRCLGVALAVVTALAAAVSGALARDISGMSDVTGCGRGASEQCQGGAERGAGELGGVR